MSGLAITRNLARALAREDVRYCHWKSNEHLAAALQGETDVDLLIAEESYDGFRSCVDAAGFIEILSPRIKRHPGLEDFLGMDSETGRLIHLHVHLQLVSGEQRIKNHVFPVGDWLLTSPGDNLGFPAPSPEKEFVLLYVRAVLKSGLRRLIRAAVRGTPVFTSSVDRELSWLVDRFEQDDLVEAVQTSGLPLEPAELIDFRTRVQTQRLDWRYVLSRKRSLLARLRKLQRRPTMVALPLKAWLRVRYSRIARLLYRGIPGKRLIGRAPLIAVVGADGAGKTRLTNDLAQWLSWKLDVHHAYYGQPKRSVVFSLLNRVGRLLGEFVLRRGGAPAGRTVALVAGLHRASKRLKWLLLAGRRRRLYRNNLREVARGSVVIAERFPLPQFWSMSVPMDGPRLQRHVDGFTSKRAAVRELDRYQAIGYPDLVIALDADLDTLRGRKEDMSREEHAAKVEAMQRLHEAEQTVVIDATRSYDDVLLQAKAEVWKALHGVR